MRARSTGMVLLVAALSFTGCGDDGGGGSVAFDDVPNRYAAAACDRFDSCFGELADLFVGGNCVETLTRQLEDGIQPIWQAAIDAGTLEYDGAAAADCLDDLRDIACDDPNPRSAACEEAFRGTVADGGNCNSSEECSGDTFCSLDISCPGRCTARGGAGASCDGDDACQAGLECVDGQCTMTLADGSACSEDEECAGVSSCVGGRCTAISDQTTAAVGEPCDPEAGVLCVEGVSCVVDDFDLATETIVWLCVGPSSSGGTCKLGAPDPCPTDEYCDANPEMTLVFEGMCQPLPTAGQPCRAAGDLAGRRCAEGLACSDGTCRGIQRLGASCSSEAECYSGSCEGGVCTTPTCAE